MGPCNRSQRPDLDLRLSVVIAFMLVLFLPAAWQAGAATPAKGKNAVKLTHACLITKQIEALRDFYREVLQVEPKVYEDDYLEFPLEGANQALVELKTRKIRGAKVLMIG